MFVFVDIETTGLDEREGEILELAAVITTDTFDVIGPHFQAVIRPYRADWAALLDSSVAKMHTKSELIYEVEEGLPRSLVVEAFKDWFPDCEVPMGGSSVHFDRRWLSWHAPEIEAEFTHRNFDVSSVAQFVKTVDFDYWQKAPIKTRRHRALVDVLETVEEVKYYSEWVR